MASCRLKWFFITVLWVSRSNNLVSTYSSQSTGLKDNLIDLPLESERKLDKDRKRHVDTRASFVESENVDQYAHDRSKQLLELEQIHGRPASIGLQMNKLQKETTRMMDDIKKYDVKSNKEKVFGTEFNRITNVPGKTEETINRSENGLSKSRHRNRGGVNYQLGQRQIAKRFWKRVLRKAVNQTKDVDVNHELLNRSKRWDDYDRNYDWENDGADYDVPQADPKKETKLMKWAKSWQKHALRFIFAFSFAMMFVCCCCAACKKFLQKFFAIILMHLREWRDLCLNRDPTFRMMRRQADEYGIQLDYEEYKRIKYAYDQSLKKHGYSTVDLSGR